MKISFRCILIPVLAAFVALGGTGCSKKAKLARHMARAEKYYAAGDYDKAEVEYINVLRVDRNSVLAYERLGSMALDDGRLTRASGALAMAFRLDTNNLDVHEKLGLLSLAAGNTTQARKQANFVLDHKPQSEQAALLLADSSFTASEIEASRQRLQKLAVPPAQRVAIEVALGNLALRQGDLKSAGAAFEQARANNPRFPQLYSSLGAYYLARKDIQHAEEAFKYAMEAGPVRSAAPLRYAQFKAQTGNVAEAKKILEETTRKAPDFLPSFTALSGIAAEEKKFDDAAAYLEKVLLRDPDNFDALALSGRENLARGNPAKAAAEFEKLTRAYKSPIAFYQLGMAWNAANDTTKALAAFSQALAVKPDYTDAALAINQMKIARGDYTAAVFSLKQIIQQHPEILQARVLLAEAYRGQGNLDDAAGIYHQMEESYPTNAEIPLFLGAILLQQNRHDEARNEFAKALELAPQSLAALQRLTSLDTKDKRYTAALQRLQKFMEKNPGALEPNLLLAMVHLAQGDAKQAYDILKKTIEAHPDFDKAYVLLANAYKEANQPKLALEVAQKLLAKFPGQPGSLMLVAIIYDGMKDFPSARDAYEKVLKITPDNGVALNNLACLYADHAQLDKAAELARRARELQPRNPSTADTLGWILYKRGDYAQALGFIQESVAAFSGNAEIQMHYGLARYMMGDEDIARASLKYAAQSKDEFSDKKEAAECLAILAIDPQTAGADARAALEKRISEQPADGVALGRLAAIYKRDGNVEKATATYESALKSNPKNAHAMVELARLYSAHPQDTSKAFNLAKSAYKLSPDDPEIARLLGRLAYMNGDFKLSYDLLKEAARKRPGDAELMFDLAQAAYGEGRVDEAVAGMRGALQSGATFTHAADAQRFVDLASLVYNPAAAVNATTQISQALQADPNYVPALMATGAIQERKPDLSAAIQTYEKALNRYPDFAPAKERLAILYAQQPGNDQRAYKLAVQAREAFPQNAELTKALGIISYRIGDYSRAIGYLQDGAAKLGGDAQLMYYLGMAQYKLHRSAESKKNLGQAINLKLPDSLAGEARRVLAELK